MCLNDYINLSDIIGLFAAGNTNFLVAAILFCFYVFIISITILWEKTFDYSSFIGPLPRRSTED